MVLRGGNQVELYDVATATRIGDPLVPPRPGLPWADWTADGNRMVTGGQEPVTVWDVDPAHWPPRVCEVAGRNLTRAEWASTCPTSPTGPPVASGPRRPPSDSS
jgi:hypothetical protein